MCVSVCVFCTGEHNWLLLLETLFSSRHRVDVHTLNQSECRMKTLCFAVVLLPFDKTYSDATVAHPDPPRQGFVSISKCTDKDCCENCVHEYHSPVLFDGQCGTNGYRSDTYFKYHGYSNIGCVGEPFLIYHSGHCYEDTNTGGSQYFSCSYHIVESPKNEDHERQMCVIGAIIVLLLFLLGASFGGYVVYKKRIHRNETDLSET